MLLCLCGKNYLIKIISVTICDYFLLHNIYQLLPAKNHIPAMTNIIAKHPEISIEY